MRIAYICGFFHPDAEYHPNLLSKYWTKFGNQVFMLTSELKKMPHSLTHLRKAIETFLEMDKDEFNGFRNNAIDYVKKHITMKIRQRNTSRFWNHRLKQKEGEGTHGQYFLYVIR